MIKEAIVRRRPVTGLGKNKRVNPGVVYFSKVWLNQKVIILSAKSYLLFKKEIRSNRTILKQIQKLAQ